MTIFANKSDCCLHCLIHICIKEFSLEFPVLNILFHGSSRKKLKKFRLPIKKEKNTEYLFIFYLFILYLYIYIYLFLKFINLNVIEKK